jgi:hypothetical protein
VTSRDYDVTQLCAIEQFCSQVSAPLHVIWHLAEQDVTRHDAPPVQVDWQPSPAQSSVQFVPAAHVIWQPPPAH